MTRLLAWIERLAIAYLAGWLVWRGVSREQAVRMVHKIAPNHGGGTDKL